MNINSFDLNLLRTFHALFLEGSTVRAAERLGLSQPAVSAALSRLRGVFGDELFTRTGKGLEPTTVALELRDDVERTIAGIEQMLNVGSAFDPSNAVGEIWLSGSDHFSELLLPQLLDRLRLQAPRLKLIFVDMVFENAFDALEKGSIDIAFWPEVPFPKWINWQYLTTTTFELAARKGHPRLASAGIRNGQPIPLDLMCDLPHVMFSPNGRVVDDTLNIVKSLGRDLEIVATLPTFGGIYSVARKTDLIGWLPPQLLDEYMQLGGITRHPLPVQRGDIDLAMLWHRRAENSPLLRWLRGMIADCFAKPD